MKYRMLLLLFALTSSTLFVSGKTAKMPERISISSNHRYLVDEEGQPFFYLADTAWELSTGSIAKRQTCTSGIGPKRDLRPSRQ